MPQMAPLMWLSLFMFFLSIYLLFNIMNYFSFIYSSKSVVETKNLIKPPFNWKW
uniref:ATP synthase complex subunit 8 n=1 Tax=Brumptomyia travassosi TaxID=1807770 RepID=A0A343AW77_9DIPT|nr:ATP synthase F0 subunit 8 [Brumptomyia travassosi]